MSMKSIKGNLLTCLLTMTKFVYLLVACLLGCTCAFDDWHRYHLVWQDEFDTLDLDKWQQEVTAWGGGNFEFQVYTPDSTNSFVSNGVLHIRPTLLTENTNPLTGQPFGDAFMQNGELNLRAMYGLCTNDMVGGCYRLGTYEEYGNIPPVMSARLRSHHKFSFTFGRVEVRAKMPVGDWTWPAIMMLPERDEYGTWPASGEIDIVEIIGNRNLRNTGNEFIGIQKMGVAAHWGATWGQNRYYLSYTKRFNESSNYGDNFHLFWVEWSSNGLRYFVDDENRPVLEVPNPQIDQNAGWVDFWDWGKPWTKGTINPWIDGTNLAPFDKAFHLVLNVAIGGTNGFIPDGAINRDGVTKHQKPWNNSDSYELAMKKFYDSRINWLSTWNDEGDNAHMQIDYIRVYQTSGDKVSNTIFVFRTMPKAYIICVK